MSVSEKPAEEHSSDEETSLGLFRREFHTSAAEETVHEQDDETSVPSTAVGDFAEFLRNTIPTAFIPRPLFSHLYREANARLDVAKADDVKLADLVIGEDCLPTWPMLHWDPEVESLHTSIQNRLIDFEVSRDLGDLVQRDLVMKGNMKLAEARELGIKVHDLWIGTDLLPTWDLDHDIEPGDEQLLVEDDDSVITMSQADNSSLMAPSDVTVITPLTDMFDSSSCSEAQCGSPISTCGSEYSADFDDVIEMQNLVQLQPTYEELDENTTGRNIVHSVDMVGHSAQSYEVDLEVYLVDDDEDLADLPEVELAIDRAAFEYHFGDDDAVDVEIPGMHLFCFGGIEEAGSDGGEQGESCDAPLTQSRVHPVPLFDDNDDDDYDDEDLEGDSQAMLGANNETDYSSEHSEELTTDKEGFNDEGEDTE